LYIPLGGNRLGILKWARNIIVTFTISGLWHGASFTFLIWGFIHGVFLVAEHFISPVFRLKGKLKSIAGFLITFFLVNFAWLFFRAENWNHLTILFDNIFSLKTTGLNSFIGLFGSSLHLTAPGRMVLFVFPIFILIEIILGKREFSYILSNSPKYISWGFYYVIIFSVLFFGVLNSAPQFIYFQF
jgi:hypothetical protein